MRARGWRGSAGIRSAGDRQLAGRARRTRQFEASEKGIGNRLFSAGMIGTEEEILSAKAAAASESGSRARVRS